MSWEAWIIFASFWVVFVTTPGPNAVNCIQNGMTFGFARSLWGVAAILTQALAFLLLSAAGITALFVASPAAFTVLKWVGAAFLIWMGLRGWRNAAKPITHDEKPSKAIYLHALAVTVINPKSVAGYIAAFSQFIDPHVPIWEQMMIIVPTALTITALSYTSFTALGAGLGTSAMKAVLNVWLRRILAICFVLYGVLLGTSQTPELTK